MALVLQVVSTGLAAGAAYGLIAIGYALIYRLTGVVHLALGELAGLAVFMTLLMAAGTGPVTQTNVGTVRYLVALVGGLALVTAAGGLTYLVAVRPFLEGGSPRPGRRVGGAAGWIGGTAAVALAIRGALAAAFSRPNYVFPDPIPFDRLGRGGVLVLGGGVTIQVRTFFVIAVGVALAALASWLLERTMTGRALQAVAAEPAGAAAAGLPVERLRAAAFALSGTLAAAVAVAAAPSAPVRVDSGALLGLKGLVAAMVAGFGSPWKVFAAGLGVGVLETAVASLHVGEVRLGPAWRDVVPLALAIVVLAVRHAARRGKASE